MKNAKKNMIAKQKCIKIHPKSCRNFKIKEALTVIAAKHTEVEGVKEEIAKLLLNIREIKYKIMSLVKESEYVRGIKDKSTKKQFREPNAA